MEANPESPLVAQGLAQACDLIPMVAYLADPAGRVLYVNRRWREYTGMSLEESLGFAGGEAIHPDDRERVYNAYLPAVDAEVPYECLYRLRRADGAYRWFSGRAEPVRGGTGEVAVWIGTAADVNALVGAGRSEADGWLQVALESGRAGVWDWDLETGTDRWSEGVSEMLGLPHLPARPVEDFFGRVHPDDLPRVRARAEEAAGRGEEFLQDEFRVVRPDGGVRWMLTRARFRRDALGVPVGLAGVAVDVTERRRGEERLVGLQRITAAVSRAATPEEVYRAALEEAIQALGMRAGGVTVVHEDGWLEIIAAQGQPPGVVEAQRRLPPDADHPLAETVRRGEALYFPDAAERSARYPRLVPLFSPLTRSSAFVPLRSGGRILGVLTLSFPDPRPFDDAERGFIEGLADACAQALERARFYAAERASAAQLEAMLDHLPLGLAFFDREGRFVRVNPALARMNNRPREEHLGRRLEEVLPGAERVLRPLVEGVFADGAEVSDLELSAPSPYWGGEAGHALASFYPVRLGDRVELVGGVVLDITERKRAEEALGLRDRAIAASDAGVLIVDAAAPDLPISYASAGFERLTGYAAGEVLGRNCRFLQGPGTDRAQVARLRAALEAGQPIRLTLLNYRRDGSVFWNDLSVSPVRDREGRLTHFVGVQNDVTGLLEAQEALRGREAFVRGVLDSLPAHVAVLDEAGVVLAVNQPWERYAAASGGAPLAVSAGADYLEVCRRSAQAGDPHAREALEGLEAVLAGRREAFVLEYPCHAPDRRQWFAMYVERVRYGSSGLIVSHLEITERVLAEEAVRLGRERLELGVAVAGLALAEVDYPSGSIALSPEAARMYGLGDGSGPVTVSREQAHATFHPDDRPWLEALIARTLDPVGDGWFEREHRVVLPGGQTRWLSVRKQIFFDRQADPPRPLRATLAALDITERKSRELDRAFLAALRDALAPLSGAEEIAREAGARLVGHLGLSRCLFVEVDEDAGAATVFHDSHPSSEPGLLGRYLLEGFHPAPERGELGSGLAVAVADVREGRPPGAAAAFEALGVRAVITAPYVSGGRWRFAFSAQQDRPRPWRPEEAGLLCEAAALVYPRLERARAEAALRRSESRLRRVLDQSSAGIVEADAEGRMTLVNRRWCELLGYAEAELLGRSVLEVTHQSSLEATGQAVGRLAAGGPDFVIEKNYQRKDGSVMPAQSSVSAVRGPDGAFAGLVAVVLDLTERKRAEEELRESERRLAEAQRVSKVGNWMWDMETDRVEWSEYMYELLGVPRQTVPSIEVTLGLVHPDDAAHLAETVEQARRERRSFPVEYRIRTPAGEEKWIRGQGEERHDGAGTVVAIFGTMQDITERKQVEQALRRANERYAVAEDAIKAIGYEWEHGSDAVRRTGVERVLGYTSEELPDTWEAWARVLPDDSPVLGVNQARAFVSGMVEDTYAFEYRVRHKDGRWLWLLDQGRVIRDAAGQVVRQIGLSLDITERKQAEDALRESGERHRKLSESQKRFVNDAAHELRAPLTAIQGNLELLTRFKTMRRADREEALAEVSREATRLGRLVNDMLALARGDAGVPHRRVVLDLAALLREVCAEARPLAEGRRLEAELAGAAVRGDPDRLKQLALQLLDNALKYTPEGGRVRLELECPDGWAELRVRDTGIGIAPEDLPRVFERFYRADPARRRGTDPGGTGLGLSIAKSIVEGHGGLIRLESELGRGTTAVVRLPLADGQP